MTEDLDGFITVASDIETVKASNVRRVTVRTKEREREQVKVGFQQHAPHHGWTSSSPPQKESCRKKDKAILTLLSGDF